MKIFVTGGTGYIGSEVVDEIIMQAKDECYVLTRSEESAKRIIELGAIPILGDLHEDGQWQEEIREMDVIIHLASPPTWGKKVTKKVAENFKAGHYKMTTRLMDSLDPKQVQRIVYVAGTSFYGDTGNTAIKDETYVSTPKGWGPYIAESVHVLDSYIKREYPIITAFPTQVYGPDSWMPQLFMNALYENKHITSLQGTTPYFSPIHVKDCARALLHLSKHGQIKERYILTDDLPMLSTDFMNIIADEMNTKAKVRYVPQWLCNLIIGPVLTEYATAHTYFSNDKLKSTGFKFLYPTAKEGIPVVVKDWIALKG